MQMGTWPQDLCSHAKFEQWSQPMQPRRPFSPSSQASNIDPTCPNTFAATLLPGIVCRTITVEASHNSSAALESLPSAWQHTVQNGFGAASTDAGNQPMAAPVTFTPAAERPSLKRPLELPIDARARTGPLGPSGLQGCDALRVPLAPLNIGSGNVPAMGPSGSPGKSPLLAQAQLFFPGNSPIWSPLAASPMPHWPSPGGALGSPVFQDALAHGGATRGANSFGRL